MSVCDHFQINIFWEWSQAGAFRHPLRVHRRIAYGAHLCKSSLSKVKRFKAKTKDPTERINRIPKDMRIRNKRGQSKNVQRNAKKPKGGD